MGSLKEGDLSPRDKSILKEIREYKIVFDTIGKVFRQGIFGKFVDDSVLNTIALKCRLNDSKVTSAGVMSVMDSSLIEHVNPAQFWLDSLQTKGEASEDCVMREVKKLTSFITHSQSQDYVDMVVAKWLGGLIGSVMGSFSVTCLILNGGQNVGKTKFFRALLPEGLQEYFAQSAVRDNDNFKALMCSNLLIYNDEFDTKNKVGVAVFKEMISADKYSYRKPYARMNCHYKRLAVLCGSSNENDIVYDPTGNRRLLIVNVKDIDWVGLEKFNYEPMYSAIYRLCVKNNTWWHLSKEDIKSLNLETSDNVAVSQEEELILMYTEADSEYFIPATKVFNHLCMVHTASKINEHKVFRSLGKIYGKSQLKTINGQTIRGYNIKCLFEEQVATNLEVRKYGAPF